MTDIAPTVIRHHASIAEIDRYAWDRLFPGKSEDWAYFLACERAHSVHFDFSALAAYKGETLIAAVPVFKLNFRLDLMLGDRARRLTQHILAVAPRLLRLKIIGMGHPMTEECPFGFDEALTSEERSALLIALVRHLEYIASQQRIKLLVIKDVTSADAAGFRSTLDCEGYAPLESLPIAEMAVPFKTADEYIATLPSKRRTQMRKKMRQAGAIETTFVEDIIGIEEEIGALYEQTRRRRARDYEAFDEVPSGYFKQVTASATGNVRVMLSRIDGELVGFMFLLQEKTRLIFKFVGMAYPLALDRSLYFHQWMQLVNYCIENDIHKLQAGQTNYITKVRMGCGLRRSWIFFKYRGRILGPAIKAIGRRLSLASHEPDLMELGPHAHYEDAK